MWSGAQVGRVQRGTFCCKRVTIVMQHSWKALRWLRKGVYKIIYNII